MVITYLLILTGVVGYACWRGYQLEVWVGELSESIGQLASSVTTAELEQGRQGIKLDSLCDEVKLDLYELDDTNNSLLSRVVKLEKAAKCKARGKK